jgi:PelA/Pel-15E family pectate lyase
MSVEPGLIRVWRIVLAAALAGSLWPTTVRADEPISLDKFRDGINHWRSGHEQQNAPRFQPEDVREICENLLLYQRSNGGWRQNEDPCRILDDQQKRELEGERSLEDTSFDNRATYPQIEYLARAYHQTGEPRYRDAATRGLRFVLAAQYANGGWPHSYPSKIGYHPRITIVDDVMVGVLSLVRDASTRQPPYDFLDDALHAQMVDSHARGEACLLKLQVVVDGEPTVWASQYDERTLVPCMGRSFELPALISAESVGVLHYWMQIERPDPRVVAAVEAAARWFERSKVVGLRIERVPAVPVRYANHTSLDDVIAVEDDAAPPLWARFYEIETNRPFMANRDGKRVYRLADVDRERRTGYSWYGGYATKLLSQDVPAWQKRVAVQASRSSP